MYFCDLKRIGILPELFNFSNWKLDRVHNAGGRCPMYPELFERSYLYKELMVALHSSK